jgi:acyl-CoA reductase-like NAD-dependent aldehyde dehydrogenase
MLEIEALGPAGQYATRTRIPVLDASGAQTITLSSVPSLVVSHWMESMSESQPLSLDEAPEVLGKAADVFSGQEILGDTLDAHERRLSALTGTPLAVVRECDQLITETLRNPVRASRLATPMGCGTADRVPRAGRRHGAVWSRVGDVLVVHAAGNSPGVHSAWLEALALGYRVAVRPSNRDPLTPYRLVTALRTAGVPPDQVVLVPSDHATARSMIERADLALGYGGQDVVHAYRTRRDVLTRGPGRSKLVVAADADREAGMDLATEGATYHAGTACTATTGVLVEADPCGFARELAEALRDIPSAPPWDDRARLPCMPASEADRLVSAVLTRVEPDAVRLAPRVERVAAEGAMAAITPAVLELASATDPLLSYELPFPCVWVAPFNRDVVGTLDDSLVVSLHTSDAGLIDQVLGLARVSNVYQGLPTCWTHPDVPHDAFLAEFLMRTKGVSCAYR